MTASLAMAVADHLRAGRETPQALMNCIATELNEEAGAAGWPGIAITTLTYDAGNVLIAIEPGKGRLTIERMRAWLAKDRRDRAGREAGAKTEEKAA